MQPLMSPLARGTLVEHLERVLCDPAALAAHLRHLGRGSAQEPADEWDADLLQQLLDDGRRLELLADDELRRLNGDAVALVALADEITRDWWPAWNPSLAAVGADWRDAAGVKPPTWDDISAPPSEDEGAAEPAGAELAGVGPLGRVLDRPLDAKGRALVLDWKWSRSRDRLGNPSVCATPADARLLVHFRVAPTPSGRAGGANGFLTVSGDPPPASSAAVTTELDGWSLRQTDHSAPVDLLPGVTEITLTQFADPTPIFDGWQGGLATLVVSCGERPLAGQRRDTRPSHGPQLLRGVAEGAG